MLFWLVQVDCYRVKMFWCMNQDTAFNQCPLVYLGQRSYGAYLLHFLAIRIGYLAFGNDTAAGGFLTACFCLAVTVPAAELMYRAIEGPAMEYGRRLLQRPGPVAAADSQRRDL